MDAEAIAKKKEEAIAKKKEEDEKKKAAKEAENAKKAVELAAVAESKQRAEAESTTSGLDVQWDVEGVGVSLDIWRQTNAGGAPKVVVWLHGGGWKFGTHHTMPSFLRSLVEAGYAIASVGYRKSGTAKFPACLHDCKTVLRWLRSTDAHGLDTKSITVIGNSAGGHLAALLGVTAGIEELEGGELGFREASSTVAGVVSIAGVYDLNGTCLDRENGKTCEAVLLGGPLNSLEDAVIASANPIEQVGKGEPAPPVLLIHGNEDEEVPYEQSEVFCKALLESGVDASLVTIPRGRHPLFGNMAKRGLEVEREEVRDVWKEALETRILSFLDSITTV